MARLIPNLQVNEIDLKPERDVARALVEQLPNEVIVYHSYPWLRSDRNDRTGNVTLQQGEADFLILWPDRGFLVLEVKGGEINYDSYTREWNRVGGRYQIKDPFEQASGSLHYLINKIKELVYFGNNPDFTYGYAVVFPDCVYSGDVPPGSDSSIILSANDLVKIDEKISRALNHWCRGQVHRGIPASNLNRVKQVILPVFKLLPVLFRTIEDQEEKLFRLTEDQLKLLDFLLNQPRVAIEGVAGSGKTMLAKAQVEYFASENKKTLFLCYNKTLAQWLQDTMPEEYTNLVEVVHFHKLAKEWCKKAHIEFKPDSSDEFWKHEAADLLADAIDLLPDEKFDAIVIDEAQDFYADWWYPIELLDKQEDDGLLYVFYDPEQNLYNKDGISIPPLGNPFPLPTNCRNTKAIAKTCGDILHKEITTHQRAPKGLNTEIIQETTVDEIVKRLNTWIKEWVKKEHIKPSQVVVLAPSIKSKSSLHYRDHLSKISITENIQDWQANKGILFSTIRSFKGLEADFVILIDIPEPDTHPIFSKSDFYVACSRAKHVLKIVTSVKHTVLLSDMESS